MIVKKYRLGFGYPEVVCKRKYMQIYKTIDVVVEITDWHKITKLLWYAAIVCTKVVAEINRYRSAIWHNVHQLFTYKQ